MSEQPPSAGRTVHYLDDGTPYLAWDDDDFVGVSALAESTIALADGAPAYDEGNMYKDLFRHWPERVQGPGS